MTVLHSKIGASGASRWLACPGSVRLSDGIESASSEYAAEGTAAHALLEICLKNGGQRPRDFLGSIIEGYEVTEEMSNAVAVAFNYIDGLRTPNTRFESEVRFDLSALYPGLYGTADAVVFDPETRTLEVVDYKHGAGKFVAVENNPQLLYYALGAAFGYNTTPARIILTVIQPRYDTSTDIDPVRSWEVTPMQLLEWSFDLVEGAKATADPKAPLIPGDHCQWCRAAAICPALHSRAQELAKIEFSPVVAYDPEDLRKALALIPLAKQWIKAVTEFAESEAKQGRTIPGYKLVQTLGHRKWADEKAAADLAKRNGLDPKDTHEPAALKSVAQLEKVIGKEDFATFFSEFVTRPAGIALAPEDDKRPSVRADIKGEFTAIE